MEACSGGEHCSSMCRSQDAPSGRCVWAQSSCLSWNKAGWENWETGQRKNSLRKPGLTLWNGVTLSWFYCCSLIECWLKNDDNNKTLNLFYSLLFFPKRIWNCWWTGSMIWSSSASTPFWKRWAARHFVSFPRRSRLPATSFSKWQRSLEH